MRREATYSEKIFWNSVRNSQIGYTFIRQKSIGYYIFDFYCKELKLAIELDGLTHEIEEVKQNDLNKEEYLKGLGLNLLRFKVEEVVGNLSGVLEVVLQFTKSCDPTEIIYILSLPRGRTLVKDHLGNICATLSDAREKQHHNKSNKCYELSSVWNGGSTINYIQISQLGVTN